jgi:hypothetical protein
MEPITFIGILLIAITGSALASSYQNSKRIRDIEDKMGDKRCVDSKK